jgi:hypothetical protein
MSSREECEGIAVANFMLCSGYLNGVSVEKY